MIHSDTLEFITDLAEHNDREWFGENKARYEIAKDNVLQLVAQIIPKLAVIDPEFSVDTPAKKCLMRIYRDVRFSKNKNPYKTNYGISFNVKPKGIPDPGYYLHIQPGQSFFAAGFWMPEAAILKKVREEIDYNASEFLSILDNKNFKKLYTLEQADKLKNAPKGYEVDHPQIEFLKLKSFIALTPIKDNDLLGQGIINQLEEAFTGIYPFVQFLRNSVTQ